MKAPRLLPWLAALILWPTSAARAETIDIHDFAPQLETRIGQRVTVTGRFSAQLGAQIKLHGSDLVFRLAEGAQGVRPGTTNVALTGEAMREGGRIVFVVSILEALPSDIEQFRQRRTALAADDFAGLYELSRWAREQAHRYDDLEIRALAATAYREAFELEESHWAATGDALTLLAMADRGAKLGLEAPEVARLRHRALWVARAALAPDDIAGRSELSEQITKILPQPPAAAAPPTTEQQQAYLADPQRIYRRADPEMRLKLHRVFWTDLTVERLQLAHRQGGPPGPLAAEAAELLPERPELAREFRAADLEQQASQVAGLSRGKMLALRRDFVALGLAPRGEQLLHDWLAARRATLDDARETDFAAWLSLAADYRDLVADRATAVELYQKIWRLQPGLTEVEQALRALGYELVAGAWQHTDEIQASRLEAERRQRVGGLAVGDTEAAVISKLRRPDRIARTVSATAIFEQWIYDGPPVTYIYLRRTPGSPQAVVTAIAGSSP